MNMLDVREHVPLAPLTTFQIGGPARYFVDVKSEDEVREAIAWATERNVRFLLWAGGSNVLVPDKGLDALVIRIGSTAFMFDSATLEADAGCNLLTLIREAAHQDLGGWEKLAGIPGTIGGAVRGNAGAFGPEIKDFVMHVRALHSIGGQIKNFSNEECNFSYRHSFFKNHPEWIILHVSFELLITDKEESERAIEDTIAEREKRHLQNVRAAGSFFMNPVAPKDVQEMFERERGAQSREGRVPAGWLIEKVGMKGARVGGAIASEQHPNYLVNTGGATAKDVRELAAKIKVAVREQFSVDLQEEAAVF